MPTLPTPPTPPTPPTDLNITSLSRAKGDQLKFWIDEANRIAGKRVLTKGGKVDDLRRKAEYYNLDLSSPPAVPIPAGPPTRDLETQKRQWAHLRGLGNEWSQSRESFQLCKDHGMSQELDAVLHTFSDTQIDTAESSPVLHPRLLEEILATLTSEARSTDMATSSGGLPPQPLSHEPTRQETVSAVSVEATCPETVHAWLRAANNGNVNALAALFQLQNV
ncbi:hypothetical protein FPV67DRAFT_1512705 [Lyophyllum atratum]|nr:hypothetical protein FPV67DRAFT_1512705 [Lyophyllum atratum]